MTDGQMNRGSYLRYTAYFIDINLRLWYFLKKRSCNWRRMELTMWSMIELGIVIGRLGKYVFIWAIFVFNFKGGCLHGKLGYFT